MSLATLRTRRVLDNPGLRELRNPLSAELIELMLVLLQQGQHVVVKDPNIKLTISVDMYVEDYETFGDNETTRRQNFNSAILSQKGVNQTVMEFEVRMGGEIRVELALTGSIIDQDGNTIINGEMKLFEGASESTGDLDGVKQFSIYCPVNASTNYFVRVNNDAEGDADYATARITISNARL